LLSSLLTVDVVFNRECCGDVLGATEVDDCIGAEFESSLVMTAVLLVSTIVNGVGTGVGAGVGATVGHSATSCPTSSPNTAGHNALNTRHTPGDRAREQKQ